MTFTPSGRDLPSVGIIAWTTAQSLWMLQRGPQASDDPGLFCRQISAQELYAQILLPLVRQRAPGVKLDRVTPGAAREAVAEVSGTVQGKAVKALDVVTIEHVPDDTLTLVYRCPRTWHNVAFIRGLMAAPQDFDASKPVADRILSSFAPTPAWGANLRTILFQGIETRLQMVGRTMSNIQRMQTDQALRELESSRRLGQRWIDTTGGRRPLGGPGRARGHRADDLDPAGADALVALPRRAERRRGTGVARLRLPRGPRAALRHWRRRNQPFGPGERQGRSAAANFRKPVSFASKFEIVPTRN